MTSAKSVPVVLLSGYLGAGKTTWINRLLAHTKDRLVVIVNDFGSVNIDAALIAERHDDTIELTNGCVCCAIGGSLADVMLDISDRETRPDAVVIECSGVADPSVVAEYAYLTGFHLSAIVTLVDAIQWKRTAHDSLVQQTFWRQIDSADLFVVTKLDNATEIERDELQSAMRLRRPSIPLISHDIIAPERLFSFSSQVLDTSLPPLESPRFSTSVLDVDAATSLEELRNIINQLPSNVVRAKGIVLTTSGCVLVQRVGTRTAVTPTTLSPTGIVIITAD